MLGRPLDMKVWREGGGMSDHFLVEARLKLVGGWRSAERIEGVRNVLKVSELNNSVKESAYQESLRGQYEVWRGVGKVQRYSNGVYHDVCGMRRVSGQRRNMVE